MLPQHLSNQSCDSNVEYPYTVKVYDTSGATADIIKDKQALVSTPFNSKKVKLLTVYGDNNNRPSFRARMWTSLDEVSGWLRSTDSLGGMTTGLS